jgi:hypothetical protein
MKIQCLVQLAGCQPAVLFSHIISAQYFSLTTNQHQPPATSQPAVFFSHNKSAPATTHQPAERGQMFNFGPRLDLPPSLPIVF